MSSTFASEHSNYRVYRKTKESRFSPEFRNTRSFSIPSIYPYDWNQSSNQTTTIDRDLLQDYDLLLNRFIPPSVILNDQGQVLQYIGNVSRFLKLPSGRTENNILEMVDGDIYIAVSLLLSRARNKEPNLKAILVKLPDGDRVEVRVEVLIHKNNPSIHYHLFFSTEKFPWNESTVLPLKTNPELQRRLFELETELQVGIVKERALVEQAQITNEELLATNEELQSANEELRSVNEELHTVNSEFENQNFALNQLNLDHEQLLKSLQVGVLFLDESQRIRKFNSAAAEIFQLLPQDIGRPLAHFSFQLEGSGNVPMDAIDAMKSGIPVEREVQSRDGKWWLKRAAPYFHSSGQIRGTVVSYTDITNIKNTEEALRRSEAKFQAAIKHSSLIFAQTDKDLRYTWIYNPNPDFNSESMIGKSDIDISDNVGTRQLLQLKKEVLETGKGIQREIRFPFLNGYQTYTIIAEPLLDTSGQITGVATCSLDITDRKQSEDALLESEAKYRNLVNNLNDGVVAHSADTSIQVCNEAACTILGLTMDQMLGKVAIDPTWKFVSEQGTPMDLSEYPVNQVLAKRKPIQNFILGVYRPINSDFAWLLCNGFPVFKNNGEIDQVIINFIDITERKQAEDALRESENRFRVLFENSPIGMAMIDSNTGQFITSNSHYYEMLGYTSEEFQNLSFKDLTHMEDLQMDLDNMERLKRGEIQEFTMEKRYYHKNGSLIWVTLTVVPLWRMGDTPKYHIATVNNITEKKAREGLLQFIARRGWHSTKENFLDSIAQYLGEILNIDYVLIDRLKDEMTAETVALYAKGRIVPNIQYSLLGTPCENVIGKEFCHYRSEIQRLFPKDSLLKDMKAESYLGVPLWDSDGNPIGLIAVLDSKPMNDFQLAQTLLELVAVRVSGEIQRMEYLDVLKKSEERQRLVADTTLDAYYDWDMITNQVWRNQGYKNLYGEPTGNNLIWWKTHIHSDDYERLFKSMANAFSEQKSTWSSEYRFLRNSGDFAYVLDRGRIFYNEKGKPIRFIGAIIDLTERLQFEDELKKAKWSAEKANNAKSEFLANISHELRTPLNGILGFAQTLKLIAEHVSPVILDGLRIIENSGNHLLRLINDILDLSKIEASKIELSLNPVMITDLLEKIIDIVKQNAIEKGLDLKLDIATDLPTIVITDEKYLIQILLNLLGNAIKFTEKGEITLKVSRNGEKILFALIDTGIGIPQDKLEEVFNPFQQLNNSSKFEGTGLGLSISQRLVQSMGGKIQVESKPGSGTKFWFEFDLPNEKANLEKFELSEDLINQYDGTNKRILIIDDDEINRMVMRAMLLPLGFEVIEAEDGKIGIEKVQVFKPDLIFMDYRMPGQNGLETTILIRQMILEIQPKIIMCSATALKELREKSLEMGCNDCITKPIKLKDVLNCLQSNLNQ
ncbi:MAG TPA: PAS domain S-box protein [Leptospiraceae bacterium]|nr:PAS domain S-box protein [Leptospiraceae bacterium]